MVLQRVYPFNSGKFPENGIVYMYGDQMPSIFSAIFLMPIYGAYDALR